jgi:peptide/nickel transport system permease protein
VSPVARRALRLRQVRAGAAIVGVLVALALLAPWVSPHDPVAHLDLSGGRLRAPSLDYPFGTDFYSRDVLSRVLHGARLSLGMAAAAVLLSVTIGTVVGFLAGTGGPVLDALLMRGVDAGLAVPRIFLLLVVLALWHDAGLGALVAILALTSWFGTSRLVRAELLSLREREFVVAARALGVGRLRLLARHLLPNVVGPIIVTATLGMGHIILIEAGLSYLGVGIRPPTPSWGAMIQEGQSLLAGAPWIAVFPGVAVVLTVVGFSLLGDGIRDALDPRTRCIRS